MTLPSASWPNEHPPVPRGEGDAADGLRSPPAGAVSLADLIADSGPLPADAALECVQRIAERLTTTARSSGADLEPANVLVDDDGGVWIRESAETHRIDWDGVSPPPGMVRLGHLLAFVATGDGAHLTGGVEVDPATLPPPLSKVATRLFSRNGACYRSYADLARDAADLRRESSNAAGFGQSLPSGDVAGEPTISSEPSLAAVVADESLTDVAAPAEQTLPDGRNPRLAIAMLISTLR